VTEVTIEGLYGLGPGFQPMNARIIVYRVDKNRAPIEVPRTIQRL
jgi:hypothetical protein